MPHDWSIEGPFDQNAPTLGNGGYLPAGIGWYRKHFTLPASQQGKRIFVEFDGVMANADIYINGTKLGTRANGQVGLVFYRDQGRTLHSLQLARFVDGAFVELCTLVGAGNLHGFGVPAQVTERFRVPQLS